MIRLSALSYEDQYVFTVESNSTVSGLAFDTDKERLSFTVEGADGTFGYTRVTADKSLLPDITLLRVNVDGVVYNYTVTEANDSWIILFTYAHSSHLVEIALDYTIPEFQISFPLLLMTVSFFLAAILGSYRSWKCRANNLS